MRRPMHEPKVNSNNIITQSKPTTQVSSARKFTDQTSFLDVEIRSIE
jgi:hypothetical protein